MKLRNARATKDKRSLEFLQDVHKQLKTDPEVRMGFTAQVHYLATSVVGAASRAGLIRQYGWSWKWVPHRPPKKQDVEAIRDAERRYAQRYQRFRNR